MSKLKFSSKKGISRTVQPSVQQKVKYQTYHHVKVKNVNIKNVIFHKQNITIEEVTPASKKM